MARPRDHRSGAERAYTGVPFFLLSPSIPTATRPSAHFAAISAERWRTVRRLTALTSLLAGLGACGDDAMHAPDASDPDTTDMPPSGRDGGGVGQLDARVLDGSIKFGSDARTDAGPSSSGDAGHTQEPFAGAGTPWLSTAPKASCGPADKPDQTLSGLNGDYRCNLQVLGQAEAPHFLSLAWQDDCAYVNGTDGTTVLQVSEAGTPKVITTLTEVGFRSNWESMKANPQSGLLAGYESNGATLTVYDVSADCKAPVLQSSTQLGGLLGSIGHAGSFSPDGTIYYASSMYTSSIFAVDLALPKTPAVITSTFDRGAHDLFIGKNGTRGYFAYPQLTATGVGSFAIMDLTQ
ncbi:MAG: hypothetical protein JWN04_4029, partial [Myxococcaceae bacterium]|nr:hypothetical protein [Myxococcaceae bacterium]